MDLTGVIQQLMKARHETAFNLGRLDAALTALNGGKRRSVRKRPTMSAAGRARIAAAQRARWAKIKGQRVVSIRVGKGRNMSRSARKRIAAAQKARWSKWRKEQKQA